MIKVRQGWSTKIKSKIHTSMFRMHQSVPLQAVEAISNKDLRVISPVLMSSPIKLIIIGLNLV